MDLRKSILPFPFDATIGFGGVQPAASCIIGRVWVSTPILLVQASCAALAGTAFTAAATMTIYSVTAAGTKTQIGSVVFAASGKVGAVTLTTTAIALGSWIELDGASSVDATGADVSLGLSGLRQ